MNPFMILLLLILPATAFAQSTGKSINSGAISGHFNQLYRFDSRLISGDLYVDETPGSTEGHPFLGNKNWNDGSVLLEGTVYENLRLRYDICTNKLVLNTQNLTGSSLQISLNKTLVSGFTLSGRKFIPYPSTAQNQESRFCEALAEGTVSLLLLVTKSLRVPIGGNSNFNFETRSVMSLLINHKLVPYRGKHTLYRLYPQVKNNIRSFAKSRKLRLRRSNYESHATLINYCNTLITPSK